MLFTAPMFLFFFLPLSALLFFFFAKRHKRVSLAVICIAFHVLLNLHHPYLLLFLPAMILYTWLGGMALMRYRRSFFVFLVCVLPYILLVVLRNLAQSAVSDPIYPVGMTVVAMCSTSYLLEAVRGNIKKRNHPFDLVLYLTFFPIMPVGPLVKYTDFLRLTEEDRIEPSLGNLADGAMWFATGFIKRIAVGAVLIDMFAVLSEKFVSTHSIMMGGTLLFLMYFAVYFSVTGYADMGRGIAVMYGIRIRQVPGNPFRASLPDEYSSNLFYGLGAWLEDYVEKPLLRMTGGRFAHLIHGVAFGGCLLLIVRPSLYILLLALPSVGIEYLYSRLQLKRRLADRSGLKVLSTFVTILVVSLGWIIIAMGDISSMLNYIAKLTSSGAEYYTDLILIAFSGAKYLTVVIFGAVLLLPSFGFHSFLVRKGGRWQTVGEGAYMLLILILFALSIFLYLPGYGIYHSVPFRYVFM
ncbi:MAG: hypothetical protein IKA76_09085 [Clostridia bacterium]|nr:hypothetical protein [Clostridia bacterium]